MSKQYLVDQYVIGATIERLYDIKWLIEDELGDDSDEMVEIDFLIEKLENAKLA